MAKNRLMTRRRTVMLGLGLLAGMGFSTVTGGLKQLKSQMLALDVQQRVKQRTFAVAGNAPLRDRATAKKLLYGAAGEYRTLSSDKEFAACFARECAILVPEGELKWKALRPGPDQFDFTKGDWLAEFAQTHNMLFRGHTLVWHEALPKWFADTVNKENAEQMLLKHIKTVAGHYAGKIHSWDVVNEAVFLEDGLPDGLRNSPWLQLLGPNYINMAFRAAAAADPQALLAYNDFGLDYQDQEPKRVAVLKLLERLKSQGAPVQALGIQAHLWGDNSRNFNPKMLKAFLRNVADLGLKVLITELDVSDKNLPSDVSARDRIVAAVYEDYLSAVLEESAVIAVLTWGLSDRYTWFDWADSRKRADGLPVRPLPLDRGLKRKLAWNAIARTLSQTSNR